MIYNVKQVNPEQASECDNLGVRTKHFLSLVLWKRQKHINTDTYDKHLFYLTSFFTLATTDDDEPTGLN